VSRMSAVVLAAVVFASVVRAPAARADDEPIRDNSFLIEEAYNQSPRVVQHILTWTRDRSSGAWTATFTEEWPLAGLRHQISYTVPWGISGRGDRTRLQVGSIHYRYQVFGGEGGEPAFAPELTLQFPLSSVGPGDERWGLQSVLPLSVEPNRHCALHFNVGGGWQQLETVDVLTFVPAPPQPDGLHYVTLGASAVGRVARRIDFLLESTWQRQTTTLGGHRLSDEDTAFLSPGVRVGFDRPSGAQIVPGIAVPIGIGPSRGDDQVFLYLSLEHAF
jgi:hypothetical protein